MCGIYKIINKFNKKVYIGQSVHIEVRWTQHKQEMKNGNQRYLYQAMRKYGIENFSLEIIEEIPSELLNEREQYWIKFYNSNNKDYGYNLNFGGDGNLYDTQQFYDLWDQGLSVSEIAKELNVSPTTVNSYLINYESYSTNESKRRGGMLARQTALNNGNVDHSLLYTNIQRYTLEGIYLDQWTSCSDAAKALNIDAESIGRALSGKRQSAGGFQWKQNGEVAQDISNQSLHTNGVIQLDLNDNVVQSFSNLKEAALFVNGNSSLIAKVCKSKRKTAYGYKWKYADF